MMNIGFTKEHISTLDYFKQFPEVDFNFIFCPRKVHKDNFVSLPHGFLKKNQIQLIHIKNFTILNKVKWIVEHEHGYHFLPLTKKRLKLMASKYCRKITFYSNYAIKTALSLLDDKAGKSIRNKILDKSTIIPPATYQRKDKHVYRESGTLNICFIGNEFIRKGGLNAWEVFSDLEKSYDIKLTLITNFHSTPGFKTKKLPYYPDYSIFQDKLKEFIRKRSSKVRIHKDTTRMEVLNRHLPEADIFLAPTYADSFGISTLEAMSEGLPIIASNVNAIPEMIENEKEGLLIDNSMGLFPLIDGSLHMKYSWMLFNQMPFEYFNHVSSQLKNAIIRLIENPGMRIILGQKAKNKFNNHFSFSVRNKKFNDVYMESLGLN